MKPSITIDERGVLLHMTDAAGKGFAVALNAETLNELLAQGTIALERLQSPATRGAVLLNVARAIVRELLNPNPPKRNDDGPPEPDASREKDR